MTNPPFRFSVCIEKIFDQLPFEQRLEHILVHGFPAFEFWSRDRRDMNITLALQVALRLNAVAFVGSTASLVDPGQRTQFESDITRAAALAVDLSCENLIVHSGPALPDVPRETQYATMIETLRSVVDIAHDADLTILVEPLNPIDNPGNFLTSSDEGFQVVRDINDPNLRLLFDVYEQQMSEGNLIARLTQNIDLIGHVHLADVPDRGEPGTGEINFQAILKALYDHGYRGYIGLDYTPKRDPASSLRAVRELLDRIEAAF